MPNPLFLAPQIVWFLGGSYFISTLLGFPMRKYTGGSHPAVAADGEGMDPLPGAQMMVDSQRSTERNTLNTKINRD